MTRSTSSIVGWVVGGLIAVGVLIALCVGAASGCQSYNRYQKRANANNRVKVTSINIRNTQQQARVVAAQDAIVKAQADQRFLAAVGVRRAQDEIQSTLTPLYVQWDAVQAQLKMAQSPNHTIIYVPSGTNGTPTITQPATGDNADSSSGR